jgi:hypothetical protein
MQHDMVVVTHHRISGDINGKDSGQYQQAVFNPLPTVFIIAPAVTIMAAPKSAAYTA